ncbi:hypothetical protein E2562_021100 [Oryza meyeriana var. granulata]|uniref:Uncharacterized protein n=1 Tax=Oryza meyeriana var. granulata TaxID=110450 RepID=A0A6G1BMP6_9ORYZ|nr:hypothetical protein E2562_021100 [Oryza meyeriana var. granulata]
MTHIAATRMPRSPSAAAGIVNHHRFLRPNAIGSLRDTSRLAPLPFLIAIASAVVSPPLLLQPGTT